MFMCRVITLLIVAGLAILTAETPATAQTPPVAQPTGPLTLQDALTMARANSQTYLSAQSAALLAAEDKKIARAAVLPSLSGFAQYIYTEPNGTPSGVFVANDGPKVYNLWLTSHGEVFSPQRWAEYRSAAAAEASARAKVEVAARGLVATVVQNFYTVVSSARKLASAQQSLREAQELLDITQKQEAGGEVAHADVVKAQIQVEQRLRDLQEAELTALKGRLGLSVLVYPDFRDQFTVVDDLQTITPLPPMSDVTTAATQSNPDVRAAEASVQQFTADISAARGG